MNGNKDRQVLAKIIAHIDHTLEYCAGQSFDSFMENRMLQEACIFNVLQIGELSKVGLSDAFTSQYPQIPWKQMYGMRNRLVHDYEGIRLKVIGKPFPRISLCCAISFRKYGNSYNHYSPRTELPRCAAFSYAQFRKSSSFESSSASNSSSAFTRPFSGSPSHQNWRLPRPAAIPRLPLALKG